MDKESESDHRGAGGGVLKVCMDQSRPHFFSLHELLIMAALAALGGVSGAAVSMVRAAVHALVVLPGGMQFLAGIHVLWLVLAVGLVRKPGAATVTGLLMGAVELLSSNPHGLIVVMYGGLAGIGVDFIWLLLRGRDRPVTYFLAGGVGAASNVPVLKLVASLPSSGAVGAGLLVLTGVAFVSGTLLAGLLGWWLLRTLRVAGVVGAQEQVAWSYGRRRTWAGAGVLGAGVVLLLAATYLTSSHAPAASTDLADAAPTPTSDPVMP